MFSVSGTGVDIVGLFVTGNAYSEMQSQVTYIMFFLFFLTLQRAFYSLFK